MQETRPEALPVVEDLSFEAGLEEELAQPLFAPSRLDELEGRMAERLRPAA